MIHLPQYQDSKQTMIRTNLAYTILTDQYGLMLVQIDAVNCIYVVNIASTFPCFITKHLCEVMVMKTCFVFDKNLEKRRILFTVVHQVN